MIDKSEGIIFRKCGSELEAYNYALKILIGKNFVLNNDKKIVREARLALEINWQKTNPAVVLGNNKLTPKTDYTLYGDISNKKAMEECKYYSETILSSGKLNKALGLMKSDPSTKKAIIYLIEEPKPKNNLIPPCMTCIFFRISSGKLNMHCHMRANNAYRILLINLHINHAIHIEAAKRLGLEIGDYYHFVDSFHIYKSELKDAELYLKII